MENLTSAISVQVDSQDKENANEILKTLGLNMSTFVNMAIKQLLYSNGLPFEVKCPISNNKNETTNLNNNLVKSSNYKEEINNLPDLIKFMNEE